MEQKSSIESLFKNKMKSECSFKDFGTHEIAEDNKSAQDMKSIGRKEIIIS